MKTETCYICGKGNLESKKVDFSIYGISLGKFPAKVCSKCNEQFFDEKISDKIDEIAKEKGLWGLESNTKITRTGSSIAVTINKQIAEFMELHKGRRVHLHPESKTKLIVEID